MRSTTEIVEHYREVEESDVFRFRAEILLPYLSAEEFREFAKEDADLSDWKQDPLDESAIIEDMRGYMEFAWDKVENHRGLSANRSVDKMEEWLWLLGKDEALRAFRAAPYAQYGAPQLKVVCDAMDFPVPEDEGIQRMIKGLPCREECEDGCGRSS